MKSKAALCTVLAASLLTGPFAIAQGDSSLPRIYQDQRGNYNNRDNNRDRRDDGRQQNRYERNDRNDRGNDRRDDRGYDRHGERGAGPDHAYYRGGRLPPQYRTRQYVVEDWRGHRLTAPPRGYQWVQSGGDYLLVAIATGVILNMLLNN